MCGGMARTAHDVVIPTFRQIISLAERERATWRISRRSVIQYAHSLLGVVGLILKAGLEFVFSFIFGEPLFSVESKESPGRNQTPDRGTRQQLTEREKEVVQTVVRRAFKSTKFIVRSFNVTVVIWSIIAIETTIKWNGIQDVYSIQSTGQLIPFIIGVTGFLKLSHVIYVQYGDDFATEKLLALFDDASALPNRDTPIRERDQKAELEAPLARRRSVSGFTSLHTPHYVQASTEFYFEDNLENFRDKSGRSLVIVKDFRQTKAQYWLDGPFRTITRWVDGEKEDVEGVLMAFLEFRATDTHYQSKRYQQSLRHRLVLRAVRSCAIVIKRMVRSHKKFNWFLGICQGAARRSLGIWRHSYPLDGIDAVFIPFRRQKEALNTNIPEHWNYIIRHGSFYNTALLICQSIKNAEYGQDKDTQALASSLLTALQETKKVRTDFQDGQINKHEQHLRAKAIWADDLLEKFNALRDGASQYTSSSSSLTGSESTSIVLPRRRRASSRSSIGSSAPRDRTDSELGSIVIPGRRRVYSRSLASSSESSSVVDTYSRLGNIRLRAGDRVIVHIPSSMRPSDR
ncbi:hypothetical protein N431DRAFT_445548 [Stipitochalara longipes BDJ]|nr:hypothetical protein N431DRAFT_445548 [Stipitochalara longipes BDJ]